MNIPPAIIVQEENPEIECLRCHNVFKNGNEDVLPPLYSAWGCVSGFSIQTNRGRCLKDVPVGSVLLCSGYGSQYDDDQFIFGTEPNDLEHSPEWVKDCLNSDKSICDECVAQMIRNKEIKPMCETYPFICDNCDKLYERKDNQKQYFVQRGFHDELTIFIDGNNPFVPKGNPPVWFKALNKCCQKCFDIKQFDGKVVAKNFNVYNVPVFAEDF
jgi:hypothetical protein